MCTATTEGDIAVHNSEGAQLSATRAHEGGALACCMLPRAGGAAGGAAEASGRQQDAACMLMSGGQDSTVKIWRVAESGATAAVLRFVSKDCTQIHLQHTFCCLAHRYELYTRYLIPVYLLRYV